MDQYRQLSALLELLRPHTAAAQPMKCLTSPSGNLCSQVWLVLRKTPYRGEAAEIMVLWQKRCERGNNMVLMWCLTLQPSTWTWMLTVAGALCAGRSLEVALWWLLSLPDRFPEAAHISRYNEQQVGCV